MPASTSSSPPEPDLHAVVLAGGVGSRFWPVSTPARPKQLLALAGDIPLIRQTVVRVLPLVPADHVRILAGEQLARALLAAVPELGPESVMAEPVARGTAPVLTWAAFEIHRRDPEAVMLSLHADHAIEPADVFLDALRRAASAAVAARRLITIGAKPTRAETGYGYIRTGSPLDGAAGDVGVRAVERFVEKPARETAEAYLREGYLWNTGIFAWPAGLFLEEVARHAPEIAELMPLLERGDIDAFFERAPVISVDHAVLERSDRVAVLPAPFRWDDVGAWDAVARTQPVDAAGNVARGDAHLVDSSGCIVWAEDGAVVTFGTHDLIVVHANAITFVAPRERAPELKRLLEQLPLALREPAGEPPA